MSKFRYDAFISYSHAGDHLLAEALEAAMQRFAKPVFKMRGMRVFRDQSDLSLAPHLWAGVQQALSASSHFILLASPESAASKWVEKELSRWLEIRGPESLLIVQTGGEIAWDEAAHDFDWERSTALPSVLAGVFEGEPLHLDLRWARDESDLDLDHEPFARAVAQIVAAIKGESVEDVWGEELTRHKKIIRLRNGAIAALTLLTLASGVAAVVAVGQARIATAERNRAEDLNQDLREQVELTTQERDRANRAAEAERAARVAAEQQLEFSEGLLRERFEMRDQLGGGAQSLLVARIFYGFDESDLPPNGPLLLDRLAAVLRSNPTLRVVVAGHSAEFRPDGTPITTEYALGLSSRRAESVQQYLVSRGAASQQVRILARGRSQPLFEATNPEERVNALIRAMNSRAEIFAVAN